MNIWLDDLRNPLIFSPSIKWIWVKTSDDAIKYLKTGKVTKISLDHDLGEDTAGTGYDVATWIEEAAYFKNIPKLEWAIHSANPVGVENMQKGIQNADKYWLKV